MAKTPIEVQLSGLDGNIFAIVGRVRRALKQQDYDNLANQLIDEVEKCKSYDEALAKVAEYVEVK